MQSDFVKLVKYIKKRYKLNQRDIAYWLNVHESSVSNCLNNNQGNTGDKFIPMLHELINHFEPNENNTAKEKVNIVQNVTKQIVKQNTVIEQGFIPTYREGTIICCPMCSTQQKATVNRSCNSCGFSYHLG